MDETKTQPVEELELAPETLEELTDGKAEPTGLQRVRSMLHRAKSTAAGAKGRVVSTLSNGSILSPNHYSGRAYPVTKVTIHMMAAVWSADQCGVWFRDGTRNASSNYGIGDDGKIMCYVEEQNAAWTSSNWDNDNRAITIEVSNSQMGGDWPISAAAHKSLVALCADICTRYGIVPDYNGTPGASYTEHKMFAATSCPGPYIHNLLASGRLIGEIRNKMNGDDDIVTEQDKKDIARLTAEEILNRSLAVSGEAKPVPVWQLWSWTFRYAKDLAKAAKR